MRVRSAERHLLQNIKWISFAIAALYLLGYIWRVSYYGRLGIPLFLLDFPFPEVLIPQSLGLIIFLAWAAWPFLYAKFYLWFLQTSQGRSPQGSPAFNKTMILLPIVGLGGLLYTKQFSFVGFACLGYFFGRTAWEFSQRPDRVQFWHLLWIFLLVVGVVQWTDAWVLAGRDLKLGKFAVVASSTDTEEDGPRILLGFFRGKYIIASPDDLYGRKLTILDSSHVETMDITYLSWLEQSMRKGKKELKKTLEELRGKQGQLANEMADPNAPDATKLTKPLSPPENE